VFEISSKKSHIIYSCDAHGQVGVYSIDEGQWKAKICQTSNTILASGFNKSGDIFATAGKLPKISLYNSETLQLFQEFSPATHESEQSHSNRICSIVWDTKNPSLIFSGGWDNKVLLWDLRCSKAIRKFGGPIICGDSIDVTDSYLITGSFRQKKPIDLWDIGSGTIIRSCKWGISNSCKILALKVAKKSDLLVASGADIQYGQIFSYPQLSSQGRLGTFLKEIISVAISYDGTVVLFASEDGRCSCFLQKLSDRFQNPSI
jgi:WD40 repeat protein